MRERVRTDGGIATTTDLEGEVVLVSGGTAGIGKATATRLAAAGAAVAVAGSTRERGESAVDGIVEATGNEAVEFLQADLSLMANVRELAGTVRETYDRLDALVHTAGIVPDERAVTDEGVEHSFAVNYLSRFLLTELLRDRLRESAPARVVNVANAGATPVDALDLEDLSGERLFGDPETGEHMVRGQKQLDQAQVANDLFGVELAERTPDGVASTVVNPGAVDTDIRLRADEGWRQVDEMLRSEVGVVSPATVAETVAPLASTPHPWTVDGRFFATGREHVPVPEGVRDAELRERLWARSAALAGVAGDD